MPPEDQMLREVGSDTWGGRVVASVFAICVPALGASNTHNEQNTRHYFS